MPSGEDVDAPHGQLALDALARRCAGLEAQVQQLERINKVLMNRVEREVDVQGSSFSSFQTAIALDRQVKERTLTLNTTLQTLERTNRELTASNEAALAASRAKSAFLAAMSHELRTPMNGVVGMTELLLSSPLDDRQRQSTDAIQRSALSLLHILNDILDFSKIEAGQLETERLPFALRAAVDQALQLLVPQVESKHLRLTLDIADDVPDFVVGDPIRFSQIITNLVGNALKFTAQGGIAITGRRCHNDDSAADPAQAICLRFEVHDSGVGIAADVLPKLFQSFFQADSSTTRQYGGTGLGLAIVRRLAELMGGTCGATSTFDVGSCFWFELPFALHESHGPANADGDATCRPAGSADTLERGGHGTPGEAHSIVTAAAPINAPSPAEPSPVLPPNPSRVPHILVVEDNEINQAVARGFLKSLGYRCTVVGNGQLGVDALTVPHDFDAVMMDWQMPVLDGLAATRLVRAYEMQAGGRVPIIALTANALVGDRERCIDAGMDDFLSKPFRLRELGETLARWCSADVPQARDA